MKAIVYDTYGLPDVLRIQDLPKPDPGDDEVFGDAAQLPDSNQLDVDRLLVLHAVQTEQGGAGRLARL